MKHLFSTLIKSNFVRNVAVVGGGIALAQAITLAFTPFLTRLYGPESYGIAAAFAAVISIISPMATMGYANAIVLPEKDDDAAAVARLSILCAFGILPFTILIIYLAKPQLAQWTGLQSAPNLLYLIPVSLLISAFLSVANQSAIRKGLFKAKARAYVESTLFTNIGKLGGGLSLPSGMMLIILTQLGQLLNFVMQMLRVPRTGVLKPVNWFGVKGALSAANSQRDFAIYRMPQSMIRALAMGMPVVVLTALYGPSEAGQYSLTLLILGAPVMLLGDSVGEVFYPKITRAITGKTGDASALVLKAVAVLGVVALATFGPIIILGDRVLPLIFGSEWEKAGLYSQWVAVWMIAMLASRPAIAAMPALKLQSALLVYEVLVTGARFLALYMGSKLSDDLFSIALFSIVNVLGYIALTVVVFINIYRARNRV
ncbi:lipopolysaccharide biosynthesis protein [Marinobacter nauticus]|uniref:lipopolysaccharide biosynthesis protein n=1 Tax=Marinobacter nauticus TaxID=2743 RepID=UPI001C93E322|nr:oligosaccharide flippase family protein [Marinobacter nauticus]MBY6104728.1 oligosaccharide flippase family protein [Marinobacter nauticus]